MLIFLVVVLTLLQIGLRISLIGIELSYRANKRFIDLTTDAEVVASKVATSALSAVGDATDKEAVADGASTLINTGTSTILIVNGVAKRVMGVAKKGTKVALKSIIRVSTIVVGAVRDILAVASIYLIVVDIIVFLIIVVVAVAYLLYLSTTIGG